MTREGVALGESLRARTLLTQLPSAQSGDLLGNGEMRFVDTAEGPADPIGEFVSAPFARWSKAYVRRWEVS